MTSAPELVDSHAPVREPALALADEWAPRAREVRRHLLDQGEVHPEYWSAFCDAGFPGLLISPDHGGAGAGLGALVCALETLASRNLAVPILALTNAVAHAIEETGTEELQEAYLPSIASGACLFGLSFSEADAGHNFRKMRTLVRLDGDRVVITGTKSYTSGADFVDRVLVVGRSLSEDELARQEFPPFGGFNSAIVDPNSPGIQRTEVPMAERAVRQWRLDYDDVVVGADQLLGKEHWGLAALVGMINIERILFSAMALGVASHALAESVNYASSRVVFGMRPIGGFQAVSHPLARIHAHLDAARLALYRAAAAFDAGASAAVIGEQASVLKYLAADVAFDAADQALQTMGSISFEERLGWLDIFLDARSFKSQPISQELVLDFIAEHTLGLPRSR